MNLFSLFFSVIMLTSSNGVAGPSFSGKGENFSQHASSWPTGEADQDARDKCNNWILRQKECIQPAFQCTPTHTGKPCDWNYVFGASGFKTCYATYSVNVDVPLMKSLQETCK